MFVNLDPDATPLAELVGDLPQRLERYAIPSLERFAEYAGTGQPANWKVVAENYLEGYHIPIAHPDLMRLLDYKRYSVEVHEHWVWFESPLRARPAGNRRARACTRAWSSRCPGWAPRTAASGATRFIYPNTAIDLYPDQVTTWQILPDGIGAHERRVRLLPARAAAARGRGWCSGSTSASTRMVLDEDVDLVDNVQRGLATQRLRVRPAVGARGGRWPGSPTACARTSRDERRTRTPSAGRARAGAPAAASARERILAAAVERIASDGIDDVRIARIAMAAGVSSSLVHYHFATREALLAEALEYSYGSVGDARTDRGAAVGASHAQRLARMVDQCLPTTPELERDWVLWVELWLRAVRHHELRPVAEELYARMRDWFVAAIRAGVARRRVRALRPRGGRRPRARADRRLRHPRAARRPRGAARSRAARRRRGARARPGARRAAPVRVRSGMRRWQGACTRPRARLTARPRAE